MNSSFLCCLLFSAVRRLIQGPEEELGRGGGGSRRMEVDGCQVSAQGDEQGGGRRAPRFLLMAPRPCSLVLGFSAAPLSCEGLSARNLLHGINMAGLVNVRNSRTCSELCRLSRDGQCSSEWECSSCFHRLRSKQEMPAAA